MDITLSDAERLLNLEATVYRIEQGVLQIIQQGRTIMDNQASLEAAVAAGNEATNRIAKAITAEAAVSEALKAQLAAQGVKPETIALLDAQTSRLNALSAAAEAVLSQGSTNPVPVEIPAPTPAPTPAPVV